MEMNQTIGTENWCHEVVTTPRTTEKTYSKGLFFVISGRARSWKLRLLEEDNLQKRISGKTPMFLLQRDANAR